MAQDDFEQRLQKIAAKGEPLDDPDTLLSAHGRTGKRRYTQHTRERNAAGFGSVLKYGLIALVLLMVPAMLAGDFLGKSIVGSLGGTGASATPVVSKFFGWDEPSNTQAWRHLPLAPEDWVRVTPEDALPEDVQGSIDLVAERWPGGEEALRTLPVFQSLGKYLDEQGRPPSMLDRTSPASHGQVVYLHPNGLALFVKLEFLRTDRALGAVNAPETWIETLDSRTSRAFRQKKRRDMLGDVPVISQYQEKHGEEPPDLGSVPGFPRFVNITLALTPQATLQMVGFAAPATLQALLDSIDRESVRYGAPVAGRHVALKTREGHGSGGWLSNLVPKMP